MSTPTAEDGASEEPNEDDAGDHNAGDHRPDAADGADGARTQTTAAAATATPADGEPQVEAPSDSQAKPAPFYDRLEDFVDGHFLPLIRRPLGGEFRWCAQWWRHAEAISRLTAVWHAWEALRRQPGTGIGLWYRDHLDHQLAYLLGPRGPFFQCSEDEHIEPRRLRPEPAPPDWWP